MSVVVGESVRERVSVGSSESKNVSVGVGASKNASGGHCDGSGEGRGCGYGNSLTRARVYD
jgi:hypothetical protein